jgi:transcriptional regulator of acetoin/glycerol metabolism
VARSAAARPSRAQLLAAMIEAQGNISAAARALGLHRNQLKRQLDHHGIEVERLRGLGKL